MASVVYSKKGQSKKNDITSPDRLSLIRGIYRSLLQSGRTYAAFESDRIFPLIENLASRKVILDPMAGYGTLITLCATSQKQVSAFCIECNPPSYLWQVLINPANAENLIAVATHIMELKRKWPSTSTRARISNDWYPVESIRILLELLNLLHNIAIKLDLKKSEEVELPLAFLVPFVGRLSTYVQGNVVTHVKRGGLCVYERWEEDFAIYISSLIDFLKMNLARSNRAVHTTLFGDCLTINLPANKFSAMITSPPYPNGRDYVTMFGPENEFIKLIEDKKIIKGYALHHRLIGSPRVSVQNEEKKIMPDDVKSTSAKAFLDSVKNYRGSKRTIYDNEVYYVPYFSKYFYELELAYQNIAAFLDEDFEGYIIVVNNTHRRMIIPVAQTILEIWRQLGFEAEILPEYTRELSHVGGINPKVKGLAARHMEYTIRVSRNEYK